MEPKKSSLGGKTFLTVPVARFNNRPLGSLLSGQAVYGIRKAANTISKKEGFP